VGQGNSSDELLEIAAWLGMRTVERVGTARYLQIPGVNC
jgi:hypothetical protein